MSGSRRIAVTLLALILGGASHPHVAAPKEWGQFRLNAANNAVLDGDLETSWSIETGGGFSSSPALTGQTL